MFRVTGDGGTWDVSDGVRVVRVSPRRWEGAGTFSSRSRGLRRRAGGRARAQLCVRARAGARRIDARRVREESRGTIAGSRGARAARDLAPIPRVTIRASRFTDRARTFLAPFLDWPSAPPSAAGSAATEVAESWGTGASTWAGAGSDIFSPLLPIVPVGAGHCEIHGEPPMTKKAR